MDKETKTSVGSFDRIPNLTEESRERIKQDSSIKSQMQTIMGERFPGPSKNNTWVKVVAGVLIIIFLLLLFVV